MNHTEQSLSRRYDRNFADAVPKQVLESDLIHPIDRTVNYAATPEQIRAWTGEFEAALEAGRAHSDPAHD